MSPPKIKLLSQLKKLLPPGEVHFETSVLEEHAGDKWFATHRPDVVVLPRSTRSVSALLRFANRHRLPVTPRGAGHGYVGGCVPVQGGIVLSLAQMNRIKEINPADFVAVVQAGVNTQTLQDKVEKRGLFYPPTQPAGRKVSSAAISSPTPAGHAALNTVSPAITSWGWRLFSPMAAVLRLGGRTHKNKTGFELHRLFVGSEGLLGVVTEATLKLLPLPPFRACLAVGFGFMRAAVRSLHAILAAGFLPAALELADSFTLAAAYQRTKSARLRGCRAHLIVELDGQPRSVRGELRDLRKLIALEKPLFVETGLGAAQCEEVWQIRREFSYALRDTGLTKLNEDIVVPRGRLEDLFRFAAQLQKKHGLTVACFGHAGDGNIHTNVMVDFDQPGAKQRSEAALDELFGQVIAWGGAITGEHGIGLAKRRWWPLAVSKEVLKLHHLVKHALDPRGILNPGKFV